jgi:hypothetical protein
VLQNVAVISSSQITPVLGGDELFIAPPAPSGCSTDCAATGEAAKSSAKTIATFVISATRFFSRAPPSTIVGIQLDIGGTNFGGQWFTHDK